MGKGRVLVVDDEPRILDIVRYVLEQGGYEVEAYAAAGDALEAARRQRFDAAVLDIVLQGVSGYEVAAELKRIRNTGSTPVLFLSSKVDMADLFLKTYDGRAEFLAKPFKRQALLERVGALLARRAPAVRRTARVRARPR